MKQWMRYIGASVTILGIALVLISGELLPLGILLLIGGVPLFLGGLYHPAIALGGDVPPISRSKDSHAGVFTMILGLALCFCPYPIGLFGADLGGFGWFWFLVLLPIGIIMTVTGLAWIVLRSRK